MGGYTKKRAGGVVKHGKYIACLNARSNLGCKFIQWEYNDFERLVLLFCKDMDLEQVMNLNWSSQADIDKAMLRLETIKLEIIDVNKRSQSLLDAIENSGEGDPLTIIVNRLKEYEVKLDALKLTKQQAEDDIVQLTNSRVIASNQKKLIVDLMQQLEALEGNDLLLLRIRLSDAIKRIIKNIVTFPGGRWYTIDEIENYRRDLIASDEFDEDTINEMCSKLEVEPEQKRSYNKFKTLKQNRLLMMEFKNGEHRTVLTSGKILDRKTPPPINWDISSLFEYLSLKTFKRIDA